MNEYKITASSPIEVLLAPDKVVIPLSQHIGAPCKALVSVGDKVDKGQMIGAVEKGLGCPVHASVSGTVEKIESVYTPQGRKVEQIVIDSDGENRISPDIKPYQGDIYKVSPEDCIEAVRVAGISGMGGATFPTYAKIASAIGKVKHIIINSAECEPFITSDHRGMLEDTQDIIDGMKLIVKYIGLDEAYIGIEANKPDAIAKFDKMFAEQGLTNFHTFTLQDRYPKGAERVLVYEITGQHMAAGVLPADLGVILSNVTSVAFVGQYFKDGVPLIKKRMTVDGDAVATPKNIIAPIGTQIHDVIEFCGGYKAEPKKILMGGPMMGRAIFSDEMPIVKNNNAILAFSGEKAYLPEETACINCGRCHKACPFNLLPTALAAAYERRDAEELSRLQVMQCMECGSCSFVCPARRPLSFINKLGKAVVKEAGVK